MDVEALERAALAAVAAAASSDEIEAVRVEYLGRKSALPLALREVRDAETGRALNAAKRRIETAVAERAEALEREELDRRLAEERVDVTLPVGGHPRGRLHLITQIRREVEDVFLGLGYRVVDGREVESTHYNFDGLNFPAGHPARSRLATFFLDEETVLRTETSPSQIRTMEAQRPPIRIVIPGKTYRQDSDATHTPMFHQVEGLVIDKSANIANMKWVLTEFCKAFFEVPSLRMRFRPSFFPFTEPSMEVDIQCDRSGSEVRFGEGTDWMEILGCGMVHPNVLRGVGLDPDEYQGFAWGMGIDRIAMLKYGMPDLRAFFDADSRWIEHYGFRPLDLPTLFGGLSS